LDALINAIANCDGDISKINMGILNSDEILEFFDKARKDLN